VIPVIPFFFFLFFFPSNMENLSQLVSQEGYLGLQVLRIPHSRDCRQFNYPVGIFDDARVPALA
jgi:hypothetical protein